jgi:hypothetical protein
MYETETETPKSPIATVQISEVMTHVPVTVDMGASMLAAARPMLRHEIGGLPGRRRGSFTGTELDGCLWSTTIAWWASSPTPTYYGRSSEPPGRDTRRATEAMRGQKGLRIP